KLVERGKLRKDVFNNITHMTRQPDAVGLDLKCEIAASNVAKVRLQAMYRQYGPELMNSVSAEMIRYTETVLRKRLGEIPDGEWRETLTIEADGPCRLVLALRKQEDRLIFYFTGTGAQVRKGINLPFGRESIPPLFRLHQHGPRRHGRKRRAHRPRRRRLRRQLHELSQCRMDGVAVSVALSLPAPRHGQHRRR